MIRQDDNQQIARTPSLHAVRTGRTVVGHERGPHENVANQARRPKQVLDQAVPQKLLYGHGELVAMAAFPKLRPIRIAIGIIGMLMMSEMLDAKRMRAAEDGEHAKPIGNQFAEQSILEERVMRRFVT